MRSTDMHPTSVGEGEFDLSVPLERETGSGIKRIGTVKVFVESMPAPAVADRKGPESIGEVVWIVNAEPGRAPMFKDFRGWAFPLNGIETLVLP